MTKINTVFLFRAIPLILGLGLTGAGNQDPVIDYLKGRFEKYNTDYTIEKTYLLTDRFVYRPGDDLWFKGFVSNSRVESNSEDFFIRLMNSRGEEIIYRRYPLFDRETSGKLVIPRSCIPGKYWLVAYTGWMKNRCPEEAFRKEILVGKYYEKRFQVEIIYDQLIYYPGDTLNAHIRIFDPAGKPVMETEYNYSIGTFKKSDVKGNGKTDVKGKSKISCILPEEQELMMLTVEIKSRRLSGGYSQLIPAITGIPEVTFYPEGGSLVRGLKNIMAFKVTNNYGLPALIKGLITDRQGRIIDSVNSSPDGLGKFDFLPIQDSCFLQITYPKGIHKRYPLPSAKEFGTVLRYLPPVGDTARFFINSSDHRTQKLYWIGVMNRKVVWSHTSNLNQSEYVSIPLNHLDAGIMQVTVFDQNYTVAVERLIPVRKVSEQLGVKLERQVFSSRQRVSLLVEYPKNFIYSNLALSVSLNNLAYSDYSSDFNSVINSGPCRTESLMANGNMDIRLLTTDYRLVYWNDILNIPPDSEPYSPKDGLEGIVYDKKENISPHAKVRVTHFPNFRLFETQTDENGAFHVFFGTDIIDYKFLNIDAYDALGKTNLNARIDYGYVESLRQSLLAESENNTQEKLMDLNKYGEPDLVYVLRYGPGKFRKSGTESRKKYDPYQYAKYTDIMDIIQDIRPYKLSGNRIIFTDPVRGRTDSTVMEEAIIVINGTLKGYDIGVLNNIIPSDITHINISTSLLDVHKYTPLNFNGVIEITTIQGMYRYRQANVQTGPGILNSVRDFYSPDYSVESSYSADNRRTLYWNPKIQLYQGSSMLVTFYTSDVKGTFYGHIVGMDQEGKPVEGEFTFKVE